MEIVERLRQEIGGYTDAHLEKAETDMREAADKIERLRRALRDIYEVYAGSEGIPKPMTAAEGYLLQQLMEAARIAARALAGKIEEAK